jgi:small conductance mechanosensitive channel
VAPPPADASVSAGPPPLAQQPPAESAPIVDAGPFQPLLADLRARAEVVRELRTRIEGAPEVARSILNPQLFDASSDYRRSLTDAVTSISSGAFADAPPAAKQYALSVVTERLVSEGRVIRQAIVAQYRESLALIERVTAAKPAERGNLEQARNAAVEHLPVLLHEYRENLKARERLNQRTQSDEKAFKRQLLDAAKFTTGLLKGVAAENSQLRRSFGTAPKPEEQKQLTALKIYRKHLAELQKKQIQLLDEYGTDTVELRQDLITTTGDVSEAIFDTDVVGGLFEKWKTDTKSAISENAVSFALRGTTVLVLVLAFVLVARLTRSLVRRALARTTLSLSHLASEFIVTMSGRIIILIGVVVGLAQLGLEVAPLLAGLGITGFVVGFALQDTLSNFASGMMILMYRPFDIGDAIEAGGTVGKVQAMSLVSTSVLTFDNQMLIVPNNKIWGDVIRNLTHQTTRRVDLVFGIGYRDDLEHAERVLNDIVNANPAVLSDPAAVVRVHELADSSVKFIVRPWVKTDDYWETYWAITREVKRRFDAEGISIPFPQRDVHLVDARPAQAPARGRELDLRPTS